MDVSGSDEGQDFQDWPSQPLVSDPLCSLYPLASVNAQDNLEKCVSMVTEQGSLKDFDQLLGQPVIVLEYF